MTSRPRILIAIDPPLLADLVRRALDQGDVEIDITDESQAAVGAWDVAVMSPSGRDQVQASHVVVPGKSHGCDFDSLVEMIRGLCGR